MCTDARVQLADAGLYHALGQRRQVHTFALRVRGVLKARARSARMPANRLPLPVLCRSLFVVKPESL